MQRYEHQHRNFSFLLETLSTVIDDFRLPLLFTANVYPDVLLWHRVDAYSVADLSETLTASTFIKDDSNDIQNVFNVAYIQVSMPQNNAHVRTS
jgi:hypothetical protein